MLYELKNLRKRVVFTQASMAEKLGTAEHIEVENGALVSQDPYSSLGTNC